MSQKFPNMLKGAIIALAVILAMPIITMAAPEDKRVSGSEVNGGGQYGLRDERLTGYFDLSEESPDQTFLPSASGTQYMGSGVEAADINGDGVDDEIIGIPGYSSWSGGTNGKVVIYFGMLNVNSRLYDTNANVTISGSSPTFGASVVTADLNGDGLKDLITSAAVANGKRGMVYIFFGRREWPTTLKDSNADVIITGMTPPSSWYPEGLGVQIGAGDIDGDGIDDLVASSIVYYYEYDWSHRIIKYVRNGRVT
ncbi:MAG: FG-GAP repeat protein, partial [Thermoplasmata archaeon]|nr:FG-GAP repeat protein [Thermoplasmata archaeon]